MRSLGMSKGYTFPQGRVENIGEQPWELATACEVFKLLDSEVQVVVLRRRLVRDTLEAGEGQRSLTHTKACDIGANFI